MTISLIQTLYLMLPLLIGGLLHAIVIKNNLFPLLAKPLDFNKKLFGKRIFGDNKTWRGLLFYASISSILTGLQAIIYHANVGRSLSIINFNTTNGLAFGLLLGVLNSVSELPNSFIKRQLSINSGKQSQKYLIFQYIIDQIDAPLIISLTLYLLGFLNLISAIIVLIVGSIMHALIDNFMYYRKGIKHWENSITPWDKALRLFTNLKK